MAYSYATYTGDGSTTSFAVPFPYINQSDVSVFVNGVLNNSVTWSSSAVLALPTAPPSGAAVLLRRNSSAASLPATFTFGSLLSSALNQNYTLLLYLAQEAIDAVNSLSGTPSFPPYPAARPVSLTSFGTGDAAWANAAAAGVDFEVPEGSYTVTSAHTITGRVRFSVGALVTFAAAGSLALNGGIDAPVAQIFSPASADVTFNPGVTIIGHPEWWGGLPNEPSLDCGPAINTCIAAVHGTQLSAGAYYAATTIEVVNNNRTLRGVAATQQPTTGAGLGTLSISASQIIMTDPLMTGVFVGYNVGSEPSFLLEFVTVEDLAIIRATSTLPYGVSGAAAISNPASGSNPSNWSSFPPTGLYTKYCVNSHFNRVMCIEHSVGFYIAGCVECYWDTCSALRYTAGAHSGNDQFSGYFTDYSVSLAANGGNASLYIDKGRVFSNNTLTSSAGLTTYDGFVDMWVTQLESGGVQYGVDAYGDGYTSTSFRCEDFFVRKCIFDGISNVGIRVQNAGVFAAINLESNYVGQGGSATAIALANIAGVVNVKDSQVIYGGTGSNPNASTGVSAQTVSVLNLEGNTYTSTQQPITLVNVGQFTVEDSISSKLSVPTPLYPAVTLTNCGRGRVAVRVNGTNNTFSCGVSYVGTGTTHVETNCSAMNPSTFNGAANKIWSNGAAWGGGATFGTGNVASGDLT